MQQRTVQSQCAREIQLVAHREQLQLEEDDRVNGRTTSACVAMLNKPTHKGELKCPVEMAEKVIVRNQLFP